MEMQYKDAACLPACLAFSVCFSLDTFVNVLSPVAASYCSHNTSDRHPTIIHKHVSSSEEEKPICYRLALRTFVRFSNYSSHY